MPIRLEVQPTTRAAIVSTVANAKDHIADFIKYHLYIGFNRIYLFIDDNCEATADIIEQFPQVVSFFNNKTLREYWRLSPPNSDIVRRGTLGREVMARQEFNVYVAEAFAHYEKIDWLLHIDLDELYYLNGHDLDTHLAALRRKDLGGYCYLNYEAIPDSLVQTASSDLSIYTMTQTFRKNYFKRGHWFFSEQQTEFLRKTQWISSRNFNYYQNGKSIANLRYPLKLDDVHALRGEGKSLATGNHQDPLILHFPIMTFNEFRDKYKKLGKFSSLWRGQKRAGKFIDTFHLEARDAYTEGDIERFKNLYYNRVQYSSEKICELLSFDLCIKLNDIKNIFHKIKHAKSPQNIDTKGPTVPIFHRRIPTERKIGESRHLYLNRFIVLDFYNLTDHCNSEDLSTEPYLSFSSEGEARLWMRRHPALTNSSDFIISSRNGQFTVSNRLGHAFLDFDNDHSITILAERLASLVELNSEVRIDDVTLVLFKSYQNVSPLYLSLKQFYICFSAISLMQPQQQKHITISMPFNGMRFLAPILEKLDVCNIMDISVSRKLEESVELENINLLSTYLSEYFPRTSNANWRLCLPEKFQNLKVTQKKITLAFLFSLGGSVFLPDFEKKDNLEHEATELEYLCLLFKTIWEGHPIVRSSECCIKLPEHSSILSIYKQDQHCQFLALFNFSFDLATISSRQLAIMNLDHNWLDLCSCTTINLSEDALNLKPQQYLWLKKPISEKPQLNQEKL